MRPIIGHENTAFVKLVSKLFMVIESYKSETAKAETEER